MENNQSNDFYEMSLAEIRKIKGYSQTDLAAKLGMQQKSLSAIERRDSIPRFDTAIAIATALEISLKQLAHSIGMDTSKVPDDLPILR
jgi:transcriptional regulator with XRE-family HTH domain